MLFLVEATVTVSHYMQDDSKSSHHWRLVEANDKEEARTKIENFFNKKTDEYSIYYRVSNVIVHETIV